MANSGAHISVTDAYKILKDSAVDKKALLCCMGLPPRKISEFEETNRENPEKAFKDSLEYFWHHCTEKGKELDEIIDSLEQNGDTGTIARINQYVTVDYHSDEYSYCDFQSLSQQPASQNAQSPPSNGCQEKIEYYEKLKTEITTQYNKSKQRIGKCHNDIQKALDTECRKGKELFDTYKEQMKRNSDRLQTTNQDLIKKAKHQRKMVEEAITNLKRGDHSGIAILKACESDIADLEAQKKKVVDMLQNYRRNTHKPYSRVSTSDFVEDLERVLTICSHASGDIDEDNYITINELK